MLSRFGVRAAAGVLLGASLCWAYWPMFADIAERWAHEPQYSHGYVVPLFALYLLWDRRTLCPRTFQGAAAGALLVGAGALLYLGGSRLHFLWIRDASLLPTLFGAVLLLGGTSAVRWSWPAICFLLFMLPLPFSVETSLAQPLQRLATEASRVALVSLGYQATAEGNVITVGDSPINVAQACGGLSMCLTFVALATGCALVVRRPLADRIVLVLSSVPIALLANVIRITVTGALFAALGSDVARVFYHDLAGWFMMILAVGIFWFILKILDRLFVDPGPDAAAPLSIFGIVTPQAGKPVVKPKPILSMSTNPPTR